MQYPSQIPFEIKRVFWLYDVPGGELRGGHAYRSQNEVIIALSGSFDVVITHADGTKEKYALNRSYYGLLDAAKDLEAHREFFNECRGFASLQPRIRFRRLHP